MDFFRRSSSFGTILPIHRGSSQHAAGTSESGTASPETPGRKRSVLRQLTKINTNTAIHQRHGSEALVMSPTGTTESPVEEGAHNENDGTFDQMITEKQKKKKKQDPEKAQLNGKTLFEEPKGGDGWVYDVWARMPTNTSRWDKPSETLMAHVPVPAGSLPMNKPEDPMPEGWSVHIHPEGKPYYHRIAMEPEPTLLHGTNLYDKGKPICRPMEIVTDSDPRNPMTRKTLEHAHFIARVTVEENNVKLPEHVELWLELYPSSDEDSHPYAGYYMVDHANQTVFWAAPTDTHALGAYKVNPQTFSEHHLKLQLKQQYWSHVECYPLELHIDVGQAAEELREHLLFMCLDVATSHTSTAPWTENQCQSFISMLNHCPRRRKMWMVSRLMALTMGWQFQNLYGHPSARLDRTHSYEVEGEVTKSDKTEEEGSQASSIKSASLKETTSLGERMRIMYQASVAVLLRIICVFLFDSPTAHHTALEKVWVDKIVHKVRMQDLIDRTLKDWGDVSLLSTVLWTANMAFLAIPYPILNPQLQDPVTDFQMSMRIAMITCSLVSTVFSVGSIAISLLHIRKHRTERTSEEYCNFLMTQHHHLYGHRPLAILWSLPFAFLLWSVLAFSSAVMLFAVTAGNLVTEATMVTFSGFMVIWIVISIWYFWMRETSWTSMAVEGRPSFRMQFTDWFWDLKITNKLQKL